MPFELFKPLSFYLWASYPPDSISRSLLDISLTLLYIVVNRLIKSRESQEATLFFSPLIKENMRIPCLVGSPALLLAMSG